MHIGCVRVLCQVMHTVAEEAKASCCMHACYGRLAVCAATTNSVTVEYIRYNLRQFQSVSVAGECVATRGSI